MCLRGREWWGWVVFRRLSVNQECLVKFLSSYVWGMYNFSATISTSILVCDGVR